MPLFNTYSARAFASQFEVDGDSLLFRQNYKRAPVRVMSDEQAMAAKACEKLQFWLSWGRGIMLVLWLFALPKDTSGELRFLLLLAYIVAADVTSSWAFRSATKQFLGRQAVGPAYSEADVRMIVDRQITWANVGWAAVIGTVLTALWVNSPRYDDSWWVLLGGPILLAAAPYGVWRKFRSG